MVPPAAAVGTELGRHLHRWQTTAVARVVGTLLHDLVGHAGMPSRTALRRGTGSSAS